MKNITNLCIFLFMLSAVFLTASFAQGQYYNNYNNYNNYGNCTYHAYRLCAGNNVYWYDSCGSQQDLFQTCYGNNLICQYGQCVYQAPAPAPNSYVAHYKIACSADNLYWYDSLGAASGLYKNCQDANSCTLDSCYDSKCSNILNCDGASCATNSADYNKFCAQNSASSLTVSFFVKQDRNSSQWQKTAAVSPNESVYFMISIVNNSSAQADNVNVSASIPAEISSIGNLKINDISVAGDIVFGIDIGSLAIGNAKSITFEGKIKTISTQVIKQATAKANVSGLSAQFSDSLEINLNPEERAGASVLSSSASPDFWSFLKRWYLWILVGLVLIFLFVVVFRRLSNNV